MSRTQQRRQTTEQLKKAKRLALGAALKAARQEAGLTQAQFGARLGDSPQTTVSRWEKGLVELTAQQINDIEDALDLRPGNLLQQAGYCDVEFSPRDVEAALRSDPALHPDVRSDVVRFYKGYVDVSKKLATARR